MKVWSLALGILQALSRMPKIPFRGASIKSITSTSNEGANENCCWAHVYCYFDEGLLFQARKARTEEAFVYLDC